MEVETGKKNDRPQLQKALHLAKVTGGTLIIAKLDRLGRNAPFLLTLRDSGAHFVAADVPQATELTIGILAVVAEDEAQRISERTKAALVEAKKRGTKLGSPVGSRPLQAWLAKHGHARRIAGTVDKANRFALDVAPMIADIEASGITSLEGIGRELNSREIKNSRGGPGSWTAATVSRLRRRLCPAQAAA